MMSKNNKEPIASAVMEVLAKLKYYINIDKSWTELDLMQKELSVALDDAHDLKIRDGMASIFSCDACQKKMICNSEDNPYAYKQHRKSKSLIGKCIELDGTLDINSACDMLAYMFYWSQGLEKSTPDTLKDKLPLLVEHIHGALDIAQRIVLANTCKSVQDANDASADAISEVDDDDIHHEL